LNFFGKELCWFFQRYEKIGQIVKNMADRGVRQRNNRNMLRTLIRWRQSGVCVLMSVVPWPTSLPWTSCWRPSLRHLYHLLNQESWQTAPQAFLENSDNLQIAIYWINIPAASYFNWPKLAKKRIIIEIRKWNDSGGFKSPEASDREKIEVNIARFLYLVKNL
jgi:hypothetical protein